MRDSPSVWSLGHLVRAKWTKREKSRSFWETSRSKSSLARLLALACRDGWEERVLDQSVRMSGHGSGLSSIPDVSGSRWYTARSSWLARLGRRTSAELF
ncbi:hypothetical protein F2Q69_00021224 [Brassica cretica]|uniref:Uncharacterized protein n=1 Tax=Brassica cretica TaxID=69181 RepID=A0A8S9Q9T8_BRACR|nr:hypothetical protein F2Q69_00021224 [Brassica cretica]